MSVIVSLVLACAPETTDFTPQAEAVADAALSPSKDNAAPAPAEGRWLADLDNTDALLIDAPEGEWTEMAEVDGILLAGRYSVSGGYELVELAQGPVDDVLDYIDANTGPVELRATTSADELRPPVFLRERLASLGARAHAGTLLGEDGTLYLTLVGAPEDSERAAPPMMIAWTGYVHLASGSGASFLFEDAKGAYCALEPVAGDPNVTMWAGPPKGAKAVVCTSDNPGTSPDRCYHWDRTSLFSGSVWMGANEDAATTVTVQIHD